MVNVRLPVSPSTSVAVSVYVCGAVRVVGVPVMVPSCSGPSLSPGSVGVNPAGRAAGVSV